MKAKLKFIVPIVIAVIAIIVAALCIDFTPQERADVSSIMSTAQKYLIENQYEQAIAEFNKVIEIEPKNVDAYLGLAEAYVGMGDTEKAIEILEKGYEITGDERLKEMLDRLLMPVPEETTVTTTAITLEETTTTAIKTAVMPNFVGLSYEDAEAIIRENGFIVEYDEIYSSDVEKNHIISQLIPESAEVPVGTTIKLTVSLGVEMVTVPDLTGLTKQEAEKLLADNKLSGEFTEEYSDTVEKNKVINQNIIGYTQVEINSIIKIIISKGKNTVWLLSYIKNPDTAYGYTGSDYTLKYDDSGRLIEINEYWGKEYENNKNPTRKHTFSYSNNNNISYITYEFYIEEDGAYRDIHSGAYSYSNGELWLDEDSSIKLYNYWLSDNTNINFVYDEYNNLIRSEDKTDSSIVGIYNYIETDSSYISDEIITINKLLTKLFTDYISHLSMAPYF